MVCLVQGSMRIAERENHGEWDGEKMGDCGSLSQDESGKALGVDRIAVEFLRKGGDIVVGWLVRLFDV